MAREYRFRAMSANDLPLMRRWLATPEVVRWWGDPEEQYALVRDDLDHPDMDQFIISLDTHTFGYLQCYALSTWNQGFGEHPNGTCGIDQFIGEPDRIGRGHGSQFIERFTQELLKRGAPRIVTDPHPANLRAVRAYEKAGFVRERLVESP